MELTYTDASFVDVGILASPSGDFSYGNEDNDFSLEVERANVPPIGALVYAEGTDVGGIVRGFSSETDSDAVTVTGDTWTGILNRQVISPDAGQAYLTLSGDVRDIVSTLIRRTALSALFTVEGAKTGVNVSHTFKGSRSTVKTDSGRYMGCWSAIWQLCVDHGCKCSMRWDASSKRVRVTVSRRQDWTDNESTDSGVAVMAVRKSLPVNHLVCLGSGELAEREVLHLYADSRGNVSTTQTLKGIDEIAKVYDISASSGSEVETDGRKELAELWADASEVSISCTDGFTPDVGDLVGGTDSATGITATAIVTGHVVKLESDGTATHSYSTTVRS